MDSQVTLDVVGAEEEEGCSAGWVINHPTSICSEDLGARQSEPGFWTITPQGEPRTLLTVTSC